MKNFTITKKHSGIGTNATPAVIEALSEIRACGGGILNFEKGEYHFYKAGTLKKFYPVSNNSANDKNIVFPISDFENLTVDGNGSVFVFHEVVFPFVVDGSKGIILKNFICDCAFPPFVEFTVCGKSDEGFKLLTEISKNPYRTENGALIFEREWGERSGIVRKFDLHACKRVHVQYLFTGDSTDSTHNLPANYMLTDAYTDKDGIRFLYRPDSPSKCEYEEGEVIKSLIDGSRDVDVILLNKSENVRIENITVRRGIGMGVIAQLSRNITVDSFSTDREYHNERSTLTADALHFVNCSGNLEICNCHISHTADDAVNMHGMYTVISSKNEDEMLLTIAHQEQYYFNPYVKGDILSVINNETLDVVAVFKVDSSELIGLGGRQLRLTGTFEQGKDAVKCGFLVENPLKMPDLHMHHNHFEWYPHSRISGAGNILIEDNRFEHGIAALLALDLAKYWYESGRIRNLVFRNNYINDCNALGGESFIVIGIDGYPEETAPKIHDRIEISSNTFDGIKKHAIKASGVNNLIIRDNVINSDKDRLIVIDGK